MKIVSSSILIVLMLSSGIVGPLSFNSNISSEAYAEISEEDIQDIGSYVIFGFEEVELKKDITIISGSVGVNDAESEVKIDKGTIFDDPNSVLVGDSIKIGKKSLIQNVFYNELENKGNIVGTQNTPLVVPVIENFPDIPDLTPGNTSVNVDKYETLILAPGQYDDIFVDEEGTLIFEGGSYSVTSIETKKQANLLFDDVTELVIQDELKLDKESTLGPSESSSINASEIIIFVKDGDVDFDKDSVIDANIFAPNGEIKMDKGAIATGSFIANKVKIEKDSSLTLSSNNDVSVEDLIDEYIALIEKLDVVGGTIEDTTITQELIDEIQDDLDRVKEIVVELQMRGFDGKATTIRIDTQMIGTVSFFDENTLESLFETQIPNNTLVIFGLVGLMNEFVNDGEILTFEQQTILLNEGTSLVNIITNFEDDDIASEFILAAIGAFHPSTGNTFDLVTLNLAILRQLPTLLRSGVTSCLDNPLCNTVLQELPPVLINQIIAEEWLSIIISGVVFNDLDNDGVLDSGENIVNERFDLFLFDPKILAALQSTSSNFNNGEFEFDEIIVFNPIPVVVVTEFLSDSQINDGWIHSTSSSVTINVDQNLAGGEIFVDSSTVFGNHQNPSDVPGVDILTVNGGSDNLSLLRGNGHGAFEIDDVFSSGGTNPRGVETGDFNNDGILDIVIANSNSGNLVTFLGDGTGFVQSFTRTLTSGTSIDAVGDFNNNGNIDFVLDVGNNDIRIFNGIGTGQIGGLSGLITDPGSNEATVGDFNNDGNLDLAYVVNSNSNIRLWLGDGTFQFAPAILLDSGGPEPLLIETNDFNNDGTPDIIVYDRFTRSVSILLGGMDGFDSPRIFDTVATAAARDMAIADFNNDGNLDLVTVNAYTVSSDNNSLLFGDGNGNLGPDTLIETGFIDSAQSVKAADFDNDGDQDIVINSFSTVLILLNDGNGEFGNPTTFPTGGSNSRHMVVGEFTP